MKLIGLYKTKEAARKAKAVMRERGIPDARTSLLAPDDTRGPHLAAYAHHEAARFAWLGALVGAALGGLMMGLGAEASLVLVTGDALLDGRLVSALVGVALGSPIGALIGALVGWRRPVLRADFFEADHRRGGTALGVVPETPEEAESARYAFRSTGALQVRSGGGAELAPS